MTENHPFHMVEKSPWPVMSAASITQMMVGTVMMFQQKSTMMMLMGTIMMIMTMIQWWRDIVRESTYQGKHLKAVIKGIKWGMIMFIISEVFFFLSMFWMFFHSSLSPTPQLGSTWPPMGISTFNPMKIPMLNTMVLLTSGISITWAHHSLLNNNMSETNYSLMMTIMLGVYFSALQSYEYTNATFTMSDSSYGSSFFMMTGFHGVHVIIGSTFLLICMKRQMNNHFSKMHHLGFEAAAWYWHFVDMVWLLLYASIYWWGN
uniref:cytochrome c oxidase subunit III n=1 Tax=Pulchriphyllium bioculatum TaxID=58609 RepID=UPI0025AA15BB|nr:cytochrome c oxidase subunit III [Pulchriphyllium bioculatum]WID87099.1 cytochrome c oxidase subunit III [Pulchriphyllium bioculatum]